nr:type II toxin-antitoxin system PrlF family antitoxin [Synechocystis salina]
MLGKFLAFLAQDMDKNPQHIQAVSSELVDRLQSLVSDVDVDLNAPLLDEDE